MSSESLKLTRKSFAQISSYSLSTNHEIETLHYHNSPLKEIKLKSRFRNKSRKKNCNRNLERDLKFV